MKNACTRLRRYGEVMVDAERGYLEQTYLPVIILLIFLTRNKNYLDLGAGVTRVRSLSQPQGLIPFAWHLEKMSSISLGLTKTL